MSDINVNCPTDDVCFKEAVCIDAGRVYDSCCDRDCLEDLRVYLREYQKKNNASKQTIDNIRRILSSFCLASILKPLIAK